MQDTAAVSRHPAGAGIAGRECPPFTLGGVAAS